jgi:hypothetical protein
VASSLGRCHSSLYSQCLMRATFFFCQWRTQHKDPSSVTLSQPARHSKYYLPTNPSIATALLWVGDRTVLGGSRRQNVWQIPIHWITTFRRTGCVKTPLLKYDLTHNGKASARFQTSAAMWIRSSWTSWPLKMGQIGCTETSVRNYRSALRNIPEERDGVYFSYNGDHCWADVRR